MNESALDERPAVMLATPAGRTVRHARVCNGVRGGAALLLAMALLFWGDSAYVALPHLLAAYGLASGGSLIAAGAASGISLRGGWRLTSGSGHVAAAVVPWILPSAPVELSLLCGALSALLAGAVDVLIAHGERTGKQEPLLAFAGAVLIAVGIVIFISADTPIARRLDVIGSFFLLAAALFTTLAVRAVETRAQSADVTAPSAISGAQAV